MPELESQRSNSSSPPPSGLVAHARMERARQLLRLGLDQLCGMERQNDDEPPPSRHAFEVQVAMVGELLERQLQFDQSQLTVVAFPVMPDLQIQHDILRGKWSDLERALANSDGFVRVAAIAEDFRLNTLQYFEWLDSFFCPGRRNRG